ncbi:MAG: hypothetical protein KDB53_16130 [Planctomycetes bacterium]|nr:hypothetical protein [Planctomycetota bacterium]
MRATLRIVVGVAFWIAAIFGAWTARAKIDPEGNRGARLLSHLSAQPPEYAVVFPADAPVEAGSSIKIETTDGLRAAGVVRSVVTGTEGQRARIAIYPEFEALLGPDTQLLAHETSGSVAWIVETLLPPERLGHLRTIAQARWDVEKDRFLRELTPGATRLAEDFATILREDLPSILASRREALNRMGYIVREKAWHDHLQPVFVAEVWPMVESRSAPILQEIGNRIVDEVPVWALSWSYVVQTLPFTESDRVAAKVRAFIKEQALPIVREYEDDFRKMASEILREASTNDRVMAAAQEAADAVISDEAFRQAAWQVVEAWVVENPRVRGLMSEIWQRPDLRAPVERFLRAVEPDFKRIANLVLMNEDRTGINPDLARVLRRRLLREDESWVLLVPATRRGATPDPIRGEDGGRR